MNVAVEISLYPLTADYLPSIRGFIERLNRYSELEVSTNAMSTQVFGPYQRVMAVLAEEMELSHREARAVFVLKVLGGDPSGPP